MLRPKASDWHIQETGSLVERDNINSTKGKALKARRKFQRKRSRLSEQSSRKFLNLWKFSGKALADAIKIAKEKTWADLIATVDNDIWGKPYRIVIKK